MDVPAPAAATAREVEVGASAGADEVWAAALAAASGARRLRLVMDECVPIALVGARGVGDAGVVRVRANPGMPSAVRAQGKEIEAILTRVRGEATRLEVEGAVADAGAESAATPGASAAEHPLVKMTMELFGAKLIGVQPRKPKEDAGA
jgi:hypothetical protein